MWAVESVPLILCVDQLEDIYNQDEAPARFRRAAATLCDLTGRLPSAIVIIACLEDFYEKMRNDLTQPIRDRIERAPEPIILKGLRDQGEAEQIISYRLRYLYESLDVSYRDEEPTFPIPSDLMAKLPGMRMRDILDECHKYRERCVAAAGLVSQPDFPGKGNGKTPVPDLRAVDFAQRWNDFSQGFVTDIPTEDAQLAVILASALENCFDEIAPGAPCSADRNGNVVRVEWTNGRLLVGVCNKGAQGGGLGHQVQEIERLAADGVPPSTPLLVRSTEFPSNPKTRIAEQIGRFITKGGRRVVVEDSDWRRMLAMDAFRGRENRSDPAFATWLKDERPLSSLKALQSILDLDLGKPSRPARPASVPSRESDDKRKVTPVPVAETGPIVVGISSDRAAAPVLLEPNELTRHAAFLGGTGCGKTTLVLNLVEQLLLRGIPAILVDRKGDLCGYADEAIWQSSPGDPPQEARKARLRERMDVALFTPGNPHGRPLSIALTPAGLGRLPSLERNQAARYAAAGLAGMMNYTPRGAHQRCLAILIQAIDLLAQSMPDDAVTIEELTRFIDETDPSLVQAIGRLDQKLFGRVVQDLEALRLTRRGLLAAQGEHLDAEALLGLGRHAVPGRTRLSILSTKALGGLPDVQFWVAQLLVELTRWASRSPSPALQAVLLCDEADLYLPALRQPPTKEPMENLLRRARSAGLGVLLATQNPGDFDYKCRDNIQTWFVGRTKEENSKQKMRPMLGEYPGSIEDKLGSQVDGHFFVLRHGSVVGMRADRSAVPPQQLPEERITALARHSLDAVRGGKT